MPVQVSYPGVYIQEISSGVHTITGVSTSIAAFFGRTAKGPINKAVRCLSRSDFTRNFGGPHPSSDLARSVMQFFDNGGTDCHVIRLAHNPKKASIILLDSTKLIDVLKITAKNAGNMGNGIRLEIDYNTPNPDETFNLKVTQEEEGIVVATESFNGLSMNPESSLYAVDFVTQNSRIIDIKLLCNIMGSVVQGYSESRSPFTTDVVSPADPTLQLVQDLNEIVYTKKCSKFEISINDNPYKLVDLLKDPLAPQFSGDENAVAAEIQKRIKDQLKVDQVICSWEPVHDTYHVLRITSSVDPFLSVRIRRSAANDLAGPLMLGVDQGGIEKVRFSNFRPVTTGTTLKVDRINEVAKLFQNDFATLTIDGSPPDIDLSAIVTTVNGDRWYKDNLPAEINGHNDGIREKLSIIAKAVNQAASTPKGPPCSAQVKNYYLSLIPTKGTENTTIQFTTKGGNAINIGPGGLDLFTVNVRKYALGAIGASNYQSGIVDIGTDDDGLPLEVNDYFGIEESQTGFYALESVDIFNLMILPSDKDIIDRTQLWDKASAYCEQKRAFLLMDAPDNWTNIDRPVATNVEVNNLRAQVVQDYSAVFYPKIQYLDGKIKKYMGPSGMVAGLMARTDSERGVWKAAAGIDATLRGVLDLQVNLSDKENGVLNKLGVNCVRKFPNGFVNWGARTMGGFDDNSNTDWKYIPVRRTALFIEESLYRGTKWIVFEPNDEKLWAQIRLNIGAFMNSLFRQGAFQGVTPKEAYSVKCDKETTTQNDINQGIVNIIVGFAPLKPAEFVIITIQQIAGQIQT